MNKKQKKDRISNLWYSGAYMTKVPDQTRLDHVLSHGIEEIFIKESLESKLRSGKKLRVKLGIDPTSPHIHLGRAIVLWKLREFQEAGHKVVFIVGDFTALIGDPSDKLAKRPMLSSGEVKSNLKKYRDQVGKIIDLKKAEFQFNSKWLKKLNFEDVAALADSFSVQQMSHRRNFADRIESGEEISLREFLYPLMQGYDSVAVRADVEIGGFDQLFNLKAGRVIQKQYGQKEQDIIVCSMLEGTDGRKMSSSWGNVINIDDEPHDMYGKTMSIRDDLVEKYFNLCTRLPKEKIREIMEEVFVVNPRDAKMRLAYELVRIYHGEKRAKEAETGFVKKFQKKEIPDSIREIEISGNNFLSDVLMKNSIVSSKSEFQRLYNSGAIEWSSDMKTWQKPTSHKSVINFSPCIIRVGKHRFIKTVIK